MAGRIWSTPELVNPFIQCTNRRQYNRFLEQVDTGKPTAQVNFIGQAVESSLDLYLDAYTPVPNPPDHSDERISLREAVLGKPYSQEYLSLLASSGRIEAIKRGKVLFTTHRILEEYRKSVKRE